MPGAGSDCINIILTGQDKAGDQPPITEIADHDPLAILAIPHGQSLDQFAGMSNQFNVPFVPDLGQAYAFPGTVQQSYMQLPREPTPQSSHQPQNTPVVQKPWNTLKASDSVSPLNQNASSYPGLYPFTTPNQIIEAASTLARPSNPVKIPTVLWASEPQAIHTLGNRRTASDSTIPRGHHEAQFCIPSSRTRRSLWHNSRLGHRSVSLPLSPLAKEFIPGHD